MNRATHESEGSAPAGVVHGAGVEQHELEAGVWPGAPNADRCRCLGRI